jgi:hypothetical protein
MPRNLPTAFITAMESPQVNGAILAIITLTTGPLYVWTGVGPFVYGGNTYQGVGALGGVGTMSESSDITANGTTLSLSGIPDSLLGGALNDVQQGLPALVDLALFTPTGALVSDPVVIFSGFVDQPEIDLTTQASTITIACETWLADMNRSQCCRYTDTQQRAINPNDASYSWVTRIQDINLDWN